MTSQFNWSSLTAFALAANLPGGMVQPEVTVGRVGFWPTGKWQVTRCDGRNQLREKDFRASE